MIEGVYSEKKYNDTFTKWKNEKIINNLYKSIMVGNTCINETEKKWKLYWTQ